MLEQLQNTLENLQAAGQQNQDPSTRAMTQAMRDLDWLTRDQQKLRDETQRLARAQNSDQPDQSGGPQKPMSAQQLHDLQQDLRQRLQDLQNQLKKLGQDQPGLKDAQKAMEQAEKSLSPGRQQGEDQQGEAQQSQGQQDQGQQGDGQQGSQGQGDQGQQEGQGQSPGDSAVAAQGRALEGLRKGAEQLAQAMQQGQGQGQQPGSQEGPGQAEGAGDTDPLGRPMADDPVLNPNSRLNMEGLPAAERAQRVLEELRAPARRSVAFARGARLSRAAADALLNRIDICDDLLTSRPARIKRRSCINSPMHSSVWRFSVSVAVLIAGLVNMLRGGSANTSQKLMRWRVGLQFIAIIIIIGVLFFRK